MNARALFIAIMAFTFLTKLFGGSREQSGVDLATPKRAVQSLEDGWRANDIEKAGRCKDFRGEAEQILRDKPADVRTEDIIAQTAQVLEMGYRAEIKKSGFPKMKGVTSTFVDKRELSSDRVVLTEVFIYPTARRTPRRFMSGTRKMAGELLVLHSIQPSNQALQPSTGARVLWHLSKDSG